MLVDDLIQGTPEWLQTRCGMATGSRIGAAIKKIGKTKEHPEGTRYSAERETYLWEVICERLTGRTADHFVNDAMLWGTENEPLAVAAYENRTQTIVESVGFAIHPRIKWFGSSPDGLIGTEGCLEVKCPTSATHLRWIIDGVVPDEHIAQMKAEMSCAERQWCDFVSYDPRMPKELRLFVRRLERDEAMIQELEREVEIFLAEVDVMLETLKKRIPAMCLSGLQSTLEQSLTA